MKKAQGNYFGDNSIYKCKKLNNLKQCLMATRATSHN